MKYVTYEEITERNCYIINEFVYEYTIENNLKERIIYESINKEQIDDYVVYFNHTYCDLMLKSILEINNFALTENIILHTIIGHEDDLYDE